MNQPNTKLGAVLSTQRVVAGDVPAPAAIDLGSVIRTLWRGKLFIALCAALTMVGGIYYAYVAATPMYRSTAVVMLNSREENIVDFESVVGGLSGDSATINTELHVMRSRDLLSKVVSDLNLVADPEFNRFLRSPGTLQLVKNYVRDRLALESRVSRPTDEAVLREREHQATIDGLLDAINAINVPQSLVFHVTVETTSPTKSAQIADTLVEQYVLNQLEVKFEATQQATSWLSGRVADLKFELETAEGLVKSFRADTKLVSPEGLEALERQLKELRDRVSDMRGTVASASAKRAAFEAATTRQAQLAALDDDRQLARFLADIDTPANAQAFDTRVRQLGTRLIQSAARSQEQLQVLEASLSELEQQVGSQSADLIRLQQLSREAEASRLLYEYFLSRLKETSVQQGIQQADSRILSNAVIPVNPALPRKSVIVVIATFLGLAFGAALVLIREMRADTFREAASLERMTGYSVIGQIPLIPSRRRYDALQYLIKKPTSAAAEAVRNMRTSLLISDIEAPPKVIMVTSSYPGEGKTTVSLALAQNLATMGKKTLVIEGDIRRKVLEGYFKVKAKNGFAGVLEGKIPLEEAVVDGGAMGCDLLPGKDDGSAVPTDIFSTEAFAKLIEDVRGQYDHIVIDTPPVMVVPDARVLSRYCDAVVFVVRWDSTATGDVRAALQMFESVGRPVTGVALNLINPRKMVRYGYGSYGKNYGNYYTQ